MSLNMPRLSQSSTDFGCLSPAGSSYVVYVAAMTDASEDKLGGGARSGILPFLGRAIASITAVV